MRVLLFKMDSDDIMIDDRINKQLTFMKQHPECMICGGQVNMFRNDNIENAVGKTRHPPISWDKYKAT